MKLTSNITLKTIGEVAKNLNISPHYLRYLESKFTSLKPLRINGRRYYTQSDLAKLQSIKDKINVTEVKIKTNKQDSILIQTKKKLIKLRHKLFTLLKKNNYNQIEQLNFDF